MHSTVKLRESDPHDIFAIEPDIVPVAWADKVLADITQDTGSRASDQPSSAPSSAAAPVAAPAVDTTFRATAVSDLLKPAAHAHWYESKWAYAGGAAALAAIVLVPITAAIASSGSPTTFSVKTKGLPPL